MTPEQTSRIREELAYYQRKNADFARPILDAFEQGRIYPNDYIVVLSDGTQEKLAGCFNAWATGELQRYAQRVFQDHPEEEPCDHEEYFNVEAHSYAMAQRFDMPRFKTPIEDFLFYADDQEQALAAVYTLLQKYDTSLLPTQEELETMFRS